MATHEPVVTGRTDFRITKAQCACGAILDLGVDSGKVKGQAEKLRLAFSDHLKLLRGQQGPHRVK